MSVVVVGAGVAGLGAAWRLASAGVSVRVLERAVPGAGASSAAAGMLAPVSEAELIEDPSLELKLESLRRWPGFAAELEAASGVELEHRQEGTLVVAIDRDDAEGLRRHYEHMRALGLPASWLTGEAARGLEPLLSAAITAAISIPTDHQVDPLRLIEALRVAAQRAGASIESGAEVESVEVEGGAARGVVARFGGGEPVFVPARQVVIAAGCWTRQIRGLPGLLGRAIRPVKGQMMSLWMEPAPVLSRVVRAPDCYLIPRRDGRLIIGATSEERGFDDRLTAGGLFELLRGAWETLPITYELPVHRTWTGLRPASLDNEPVLGQTSVGGLVMAAGLYRNGILLTPIVAELIAEAVLTEAQPALAAACSPLRLE